MFTCDGIEVLLADRSARQTHLHLPLVPTLGLAVDIGNVKKRGERDRHEDHDREKGRVAMYGYYGTTQLASRSHNALSHPHTGMVVGEWAS